MRHYSDEGRRLLREGLSGSSPRAAAAAPAPQARVLSVDSIQTELEDVKAVFGRKAVGPVVPRADGGVDVTLLLQIHSCVPSPPPSSPEILFDPRVYGPQVQVQSECGVPQRVPRAAIGVQSPRARLDPGAVPAD